VAVTQLNTVLGILVSYFTNYVIASIFSAHAAEGALVAWRWMFGIVAAPSVLFFLLALSIPESPRWLVKQQRPKEGQKILGELGNEDVESLLDEIAESLHQETVRTTEPFFQRKYRKPILLAIMVASFNQLTGINALIYYTADIFRMAGAGRAGALLQSVIIGATCLVFTLLAMAVIDRFGRKRMLVVGAAMAFVFPSLPTPSTMVSAVDWSSVV
jgi:MFS family permease